MVSLGSNTECFYLYAYFPSMIQVTHERTRPIGSPPQTCFFCALLCQNPIVGHATIRSIGIDLHMASMHKEPKSSVIDHEVNNWLEVGACHPCSVYPGGLVVLVAVTGFLCLPQELQSSTANGFTILCPDLGQSSSKPGADDAVPYKHLRFTTGTRLEIPQHSGIRK